METERRAGRGWLALLIAVAIGLAIGVIVGERITERRFLKQSIVAPPPEWIELYGDGLKSRQIWNSAAMTNELKTIQAGLKEQAKGASKHSAALDHEVEKLERKINQKADK